MLLCRLFYLQPLLMWLITPPDWLLATVRKMEDTFRPPHLTIACGARLFTSSFGERQKRCEFSEAVVYPERAADITAVLQLFPALTHTHTHTLLCINTWELPLRASLTSRRVGAADSSIIVTHHLLHPHVSPATAGIQHVRCF